MELSATGVPAFLWGLFLPTKYKKRLGGEEEVASWGLLYSQREALISPTLVWVGSEGVWICVSFLNPREGVYKEILYKVPECPGNTTFWAQKLLFRKLQMPWDAGGWGRREGTDPREGTLGKQAESLPLSMAKRCMFFFF